MKLIKLSPIALLAALALTGCGGGGGQAGGAFVDVSLTQAMTDSPQVVNAPAGDTVRWTNTATTLPHTVTSDTSQAGLDSSGSFPAGLQPGDQFTWTVPANAAIGTHYFYHCNFHGAAGNGTSLGTGMAGEITVD